LFHLVANCHESLKLFMHSVHQLAPTPLGECGFARSLPTNTKALGQTGTRL
jgi:hypothetical protein